MEIVENGGDYGNHYGIGKAKYYALLDLILFLLALKIYHQMLQILLQIKNVVHKFGIIRLVI